MKHLTRTSSSRAARDSSNRSHVHVATGAFQRTLGEQEVAMTTKVHREFESLSSAAERTGLSIRTLRRRIANGDLPAYRSGPRVIRVNPADVDHLMVRIPSAWS